jgi:microcin C transport system permease protein
VNPATTIKKNKAGFSRLFSLNPLARKRWIRFKNHRRGFLSLILLIGLYIVSLFSEFICNDRPLLVRYNHHYYFPVVRFYPDDTFTQSGRATRPDYKKINESKTFKSDESNFMLFPLVPYGPNEIINPDSLKGEERVDITMRPVPRIGSANIDHSYKVVRSQSADYFLPPQFDIPLTNIWQFSDQILVAIERRFSNEPDQSIRVLVPNRTNGNQQVEISMASYKSRSEPPRDVRLTFQEMTNNTPKPGKLTFDINLNVINPDGLWKNLGEEQKLIVSELARKGLAGQPAEVQLNLDGYEFRLQVIKRNVQWPFYPNSRHWWGIDNAGRDVFARILYGLRTSMTFGLLLVVFSMAFGILMGALQGYYGGSVDLISQRLIEIWSTIPFLYVMIWLGAIYGRSFSLLLFCYGIFNWIGISYYVRAEFLRLRNTPFVDAARCLGLSSGHIMFRHILPNAMTPIITFFPFSLVGAIGSLALLDFLGFGLPPPTASWGEMLQQAQSFRWAWWLIVYPTAALVTVIMLGVLIGEGVRDAYDPKPLMKME